MLRKNSKYLQPISLSEGIISSLHFWKIAQILYWKTRERQSTECSKKLDLIRINLSRRSVPANKKTVKRAIKGNRIILRLVTETMNARIKTQEFIRVARTDLPGGTNSLRPPKASTEETLVSSSSSSTRVSRAHSRGSSGIKKSQKNHLGRIHKVWLAPRRSLIGRR